MEKVCVALLVLCISAPTLACGLTSPQRKYFLYQAVQLLEPASGRAATKGPFRVRAERYYNNARSAYIPVKKIHVHEYRSWANERNEWNTGRRDTFELRFSAEVGKYYQVRVEWEDGSTYTWEYQMEPGGTTVRISEPR